MYQKPASEHTSTRPCEDLSELFVSNTQLAQELAREDFSVIQAPHSTTPPSASTQDFIVSNTQIQRELDIERMKPSYNLVRPLALAHEQPHHDRS
jgi:hypothetical protein